MRRKIALLSCLLILLMCLFGCKSNNIDSSELKKQFDEYIKENLANGSLQELQQRYLESEDNYRYFSLDELTGENGTLTVATKIGEPTVIEANGKYTGSTFEMMFDFCKKHGYSMKMDIYESPNDLVLAVSSGKADFAGANLSVTEEREKMIDFSEHYQNVASGFTVRKEDVDKYKTLSYLEGKKIGIEAGTCYREWSSAALNDNLEIYEYPSTTDMHLALQSGKVDAVIEDDITAAIASRRFTDHARSVYLPNIDEHALAFKKSNEGKGFFEVLKDKVKTVFIKDDRWKQFISGALTTLAITLSSIILGSLLGFIIFYLTRNAKKFSTKLMNAADLIIGRMPTVVFLLIFYYIIFGSTSLNGVVISSIVFTILVATSFISLMRNAVKTIDKGQYEASYAMGYSEKQTFLKIIVPQALEFFWPGYKSTIIDTIKGTSIVGYIAVQDVTKTGDIVRSLTFESVLPLVVVAIIYYLLAFILIRIVKGIEINTKPSKKKVEKYLKGVDLHD